MEHAQAKEKLLSSLWLSCLLQKLFLEGFGADAAPAHVGCQTARWLVRHLDTVAQHQGWEGARAVRAEPEAEGGMSRCPASITSSSDILARKLVADLLQAVHPRGMQMTVLQQHPAA